MSRLRHQRAFTPPRRRPFGFGAIAALAFASLPMAMAAPMHGWHRSRPAVAELPQEYRVNVDTSLPDRPSPAVASRGTSSLTTLTTRRPLDFVVRLGLLRCEVLPPTAYKFRFLIPPPPLLNFGAVAKV